jgi:hypothetical protein
MSVGNRVAIITTAVIPITTGFPYFLTMLFLSFSYVILLQPNTTNEEMSDIKNDFLEKG